MCFGFSGIFGLAPSVPYTPQGQEVYASDAAKESGPLLLLLPLLYLGSESVCYILRRVSGLKKFKKQIRWSMKWFNPTEFANSERLK